MSDDCVLESGLSDGSSPRSPQATEITRSRLRAVVGVAAAGAMAACVVLVRPAKQPSDRNGAPRQWRGAEFAQLAAVSTESELVPQEEMHDGNVCADNEELYMGLCYKRCSLLTMGAAPIRTSSWTCCEGHPCGVMNEHGSMGDSLMCGGYDVDGQGGCPHKPGACLVDEEMHLGICYKKCSILTQGEYPHRTAASTCCKETGMLSCMNPWKAKTNPAFDVGGGNGDQDPSTPDEAHPPEARLTEGSGSQAEIKTAVAPVAFAAPAAAEPEPVNILDVEPTEHLHDGNVCDDTEELYDGLCYKRCSLLTEGAAPIRTSSWTCCEGHPCGIWNQKGSVGTTIACDGFDVDGSGGCPHKPGACLVDEELFLGVCYKKCSLLTQGQFPHRVAAASCCKTQGMGCLNPWNDRTRKSFDVGGGAQGHDESAHLPEESLTEAIGAAASEEKSTASDYAEVESEMSQAFNSVEAAADTLAHDEPATGSADAEADEEAQQRAAIIAAMRK